MDAVLSNLLAPIAISVCSCCVSRCWTGPDTFSQECGLELLTLALRSEEVDPESRNV